MAFIKVKNVSLNEEVLKSLTQEEAISKFGNIPPDIVVKAWDLANPVPKTTTKRKTRKKK